MEGLGKWVEEITIESIPELYRDMAEAIGVDSFLKLLNHVDGDTVYIPTVNFILRPIRDEKIRAEYDGYNQKF